MCISLLLSLLPLLSFLLQGAGEQVDTRLGTQAAQTNSAGRFGKHTEEQGHTLPAVLVPHGMTFWTPQTRNTEKKGVCPYYSTDERLQGFRASHWLVGGCTQDYGSFTLMPLTDRSRLKAVERAQKFTDETALPHYYSVRTRGVFSEMTATSRTAIFRFTFANANEAFLAFEVNSDEGLGTLGFDEKNKRIVAGNPVHRIYQGKGGYAGMTGYCIVQFQDGDVAEYGVEDGIIWVRLAREQVLVKCANSFVSADGALNNMDCEQPGWDFEKTKTQLESVWQKEFDRIRIGETFLCDRQKEMLLQFRTAQYHAAFLPHDISDCDGRHPQFGSTSSIPSTSQGAYFMDFSAWDTYRALHPLLTIISPSLVGSMMNTLIGMYESTGWLPIFPCWNSYTSAMIGDHCAAILAEAAVKGIKGFDYRTAYEAMLKNATQTPAAESDYIEGKGRRALRSYMQYGCVPLEDTVPHAYHKREQASRTLEYAYDDYCVAQMARLLADQKNYDLMLRRSGNWRNVFDLLYGNYDADLSVRPSYITEGWQCHYIWYVPHDVEGLIKAFSGKRAFVDRLDSLFTQRLYWHGNEPCHQVAYMFNYADAPQKTQQWVRFILDTEYAPTLGGLSGNDDAGQMSAWYIFSALGFYPVCPVSGEYAIGSPVFPKTEIPLENGKTFTIIAHDASPENIYVSRATLNGKPLKRMFISHEDIVKGGILECWMGKK
ncbi:MAG: glycoside hydrolase family 92 protein [Bacteroidaceae bacterium]|nr:glycoside hydrolase family 92 protein [Bacteroidaceae bacterium]